MTNTTNTAEYLRGATNDEIDDVSHLKMQRKKARYEVYRLWARLFRL